MASRTSKAFADHVGTQAHLYFCNDMPIVSSDTINRYSSPKRRTTRRAKSYRNLQLQRRQERISELSVVHKYCCKSTLIGEYIFFWWWREMRSRMSAANSWSCLLCAGRLIPSRASCADWAHCTAHLKPCNSNSQVVRRQTTFVIVGRASGVFPRPFVSASNGHSGDASLLGAVSTVV
jgi:hypothetical protein